MSLVVASSLVESIFYLIQVFSFVFVFMALFVAGLYAIYRIGGWLGEK